MLPVQAYESVTTAQGEVTSRFEMTTAPRFSFDSTNAKEGVTDLR